MKLFGPNDIHSETPLAKPANALVAVSYDNAFAEVFSDSSQMVVGGKTGAKQSDSLAPKENGGATRDSDEESAAMLVCGTTAPLISYHYKIGPMALRPHNESGETAAAPHPTADCALRKDASGQMPSADQQGNEADEPFHFYASSPKNDGTHGANADLHPKLPPKNTGIPPDTTPNGASLHDPKPILSPPHTWATEKANPQPGLAVDPKNGISLQSSETGVAPLVDVGVVNLTQKGCGAVAAAKAGQTTLEVPRREASKSPSTLEGLKADGKENPRPNPPPSAGLRMVDQTLSAPLGFTLSPAADPTQFNTTSVSAGLTPPPALAGTQPLMEMYPNGLGQDSQDGAMSLSFNVAALDHAHLAPTKTAHVAMAEVPQSISRQITNALLLQHDRPVELILSPEELGKVRLTLTTTDIGITVSIVAERSETLELMRRNIEVLDRDFREMGYENTSFNFGQQSQHEQPGPQPDPARDISQLLPLNLSRVSAEPLVLSLNGSDGLDLRF